MVLRFKASTRYVVAFLLALYLYWLPKVNTLATRLPPELTKAALSLFEHGAVRLDGAITLPDGTLFLPLIPSKSVQQKHSRVKLQAIFPNHESPNIIAYSNGWVHIRVLNKEGTKALAFSKDVVPHNLKERIFSCKLPADLIVPEGLVVPKSLKFLVGDLPIVVVNDDVLAKADLGAKVEVQKPYHGKGMVFLTSIASGKIVLLSGDSLARLVEFPTEGTPCGMEFIGSKLYIADQAKDRILLLNVAGRKFIGQIDFPARTAPKDVTALPNGKLFYVSESGSANIAVLETASGKVLVRTKVSPGPGKMAITPDGVFLIVLNVASGQVAVISTYNQKLIGYVKVGDMPTAVVCANDSRIAYVTNRISNTVSVIDISKRQVVNNIPTGDGPTGIALSLDNSKLYVAIGRENVLSLFDTSTQKKISDIRLPSYIDFPGNICLLPDGKRLVISSQQTEAIAVMNTETLAFEKPINLSHPVHEVIWVPAD